MAKALAKTKTQAEGHGFPEGVRLVSADEVWSAMAFRRK